MATTADKDVGRLDVAVNDVRVVRGIERIRDFDAECQHCVQWQTAMIDESVLQRGAFEALHDDKGAAILLADIVNGANVRVVQRRRGSSLAAKATQRVRVASQFIRQELQRHDPLERRIRG